MSDYDGTVGVGSSIQGISECSRREVGSDVFVFVFVERTVDDCLVLVCHFLQMECDCSVRRLSLAGRERTAGQQ